MSNVAQDVQASGKLGATMCKTKNLDGRADGPRLEALGAVGRGQETPKASTSWCSETGAATLTDATS